MLVGRVCAATLFFWSFTDQGAVGLFPGGNKTTLEERKKASRVLEALVSGRCKVRTCDFHRVKMALYR